MTDDITGAIVPLLGVAIVADVAGKVIGKNKMAFKPTKTPVHHKIFAKHTIKWGKLK